MIKKARYYFRIVAGESLDCPKARLANIQFAEISFVENRPLTSWFEVFQRNPASAIRFILEAF